MTDPQIDPDEDTIASEVGTTSIRGRKDDRRRLANNGLILAPADLSATLIEAQVERGGAFEVFPGTGAADGTFRIDGVPRNRPYWIRVGANWYFTRERVVDVGLDIIGRPDAPIATAGTRLVLDVDGLSPVTAGDDFQLQSPDAGVGFYSTASFLNPFSANAPAVGDTELAGAELPFDADPALGTAAFPIIQASRGDTFTLAQLTTRQAGAVVYQSATRGLTVPLEMAQGAITTVGGTMTTLATTTTPVDYRLDAFERQADDVAPGAAATGSNLFVDPNPVGRTVNLGTPDLVVANFGAGAGDQVIPFEYGNPYPAEWPIIGIASTTFGFPYVGPTPDGGTAARTLVTANLAWRAVHRNRLRMTPAVSAVRDIEIDGRERAGDVQVAGATPVVSWDEPCDGRPSVYQVRVIRLNAQAPFATTLARLTVDGHTDRIRIPAGLMLPGQHYQVQIRAIATAEHRGDSKLEPTFVAPAGTANAASITIRVE